MFQNEPPVIGLDIDGVLANFGQAFINHVHNNTENTQFPKHWTEWDSWFPPGGEDAFSKVFPKIKGDPDFWLNQIQPHDDAFIDFPVHHYVTARDVPSEITAQWLALHGFPEAPVTSVPVNASKLQVMKDLRIDLFVDDKPSTFDELNENGVTCLLMRRPHNRSHNTYVWNEEAGLIIDHEVHTLVEVRTWLGMSLGEGDTLPPLQQLSTMLETSLEVA